MTHFPQHPCLYSNTTQFLLRNKQFHSQFFGAIVLCECAQILGFRYDIFMHCGVMQICTYGSVLEDDIPFSLVYSHLLHSSFSPTTVCVLY